MSEQVGNMFNDKQAAIEQAIASLKMVEALAQRHGFPFLAVIERDGWLNRYRHFPEEDTCSELNAAWYELGGD